MLNTVLLTMLDEENGAKVVRLSRMQNMQSHACKENIG
jgi:hypothetical protein